MTSSNMFHPMNEWQFEDDEDESGKNPARRVPARFVLLRRDLEEIDDSEFLYYSLKKGSTMFCASVCMCMCVPMITLMF